MGSTQLHIRDFGEKVAYLVGRRGKPELCRDFNAPLPTEFPIFKSAAAFAKRLGKDPSTLSQWKDDVGRDCRYRLPPNLAEVETVARMFGIWPKSNVSDLLTFWKDVWPSWYSGEATQQYTVDYVRPKASRGKPASDGKPDSLDAFQKAYCEALRQYQRDPASSPLHFPLVKDQQAIEKAVRDLVKLVRKAPQVLVRLKSQPGMDGLPYKPSSDSAQLEADITSAVKWLVGCDIDIVINACQQAYLTTHQNFVALRNPDVIPRVRLLIRRRFGNGWDFDCRCGY